MALLIPLIIEGAEYRGTDPSEGSFVNDEGATIEFGPKVKFELELPNGDVALLPVSGFALDRLEPAVDHKSFKRGERMGLDCVVSFRDNVPRGEAYVRVLAVRRKNGAGAGS